jgi:hypothetical protein
MSPAAGDPAGGSGRATRRVSPRSVVVGVGSARVQSLRALVVLTAVLVAAGCVCRPAPEPVGPRVPIERVSVPPYREVADIDNDRAEPLGRLWIPTTCRIWFYEEDGRERQEQLDGLLTYVRPWRFHLRLDKISQMVAILGSNEDHYWWFEFGDEKRAWIGSHEAVTPERIAELGLPVHPLDLAELLGVVPLPEPGGSSLQPPDASPPAPPMWSQDGRWLIVTAPARIGWRRLWLDPESDLEPGRIELVDQEGRTALLAELSDFALVNLPGTRERSRAAREVVLFLDARGTRARMRLEFQERPGRIRDAAFDLDGLRRSYNIRDEHVTWLDEEGIASRGGSDEAGRLSSRP